MKTEFFKDWENLIDSFEVLMKSEDNPFFKSKYVPLKVILPIVKKHCKENNFIFFQIPRIIEGKNCLVTRFTHISGEIIEGEIEIVAKDPNDPQKVGGGITYMRRYMFTTMLGLEEDDDDGNYAAGNNWKKEEASRPKPLMVGNETVPF